MKINRLVVPLTAFAAAAALTACGGSGEESSAKPVTVWMYPVIADEKAATAYWTQVEKDFEAANTDVDLRIEQQPWANRDQKLATAFSGGKGPDVLLLGPDQIPQFVKTGSLEPIDKVLEADKSKFLPGALSALTVDGKLYGAPIYHTVTTTLYNKKLLDKAGITKPPETWAEIKAAAPKLKQAGVATLDYSASPETSLNLSFYPLLWQAGGSVFAEDGKKVAFNQAPGVEALTFIKEPVRRGRDPEEQSDQRQRGRRPGARQAAGRDGLHQHADRRQDRERELGRGQCGRRRTAGEQEAGRVRAARRARGERGVEEHRGSGEVPHLHDPAEAGHQPGDRVELPVAAHRRAGAGVGRAGEEVRGSPAVRLPR